jgi:hypothetical protein
MELHVNEPFHAFAGLVDTGIAGFIPVFGRWSMVVRQSLNQFKKA